MICQGHALQPRTRPILCPHPQEQRGTLTAAVFTSFGTLFLLMPLAKSGNIFRLRDIRVINNMISRDFKTCKIVSSASCNDTFVDAVNGWLHLENGWRRKTLYCTMESHDVFMTRQTKTPRAVRMSRAALGVMCLSCPFDVSEEGRDMFRRGVCLSSRGA